MRSGFITQSVRNYSERYKYEISANIPQGLNCYLESVNALVEERCAKVDHWQTSSQRHRWLATALLDIEPRLRKVMGYRHLSTLRDALKRELKIDTTTSKEKAA